MIECLPLLSTDDVLRDIVNDVMEIRIREHAVMQRIAELDRRGAASELGYKNLAYVLRDAVRWDRTIAKRRIDHARLLASEVTPTGSELPPELPVTASAAAEGALSIEHVAAVAEAMKTLPADAEASVVDFAREHEPSSVRSFGKELAYRLYQDDPEPRDADPAPQVNDLTLHWRGDLLKVSGTLDKVTGAKFEALIDPLAKPRPTSEEGPDPRSRTERQGDAFAELVDLMLRADQMPEHGGEPVTLTLTMRYEDLAGQVGSATLDTRERIPADQIRQLACSAGIIPLVLGTQSQPLDVGRKARTFTAGIRRLLVIRDRGCAFPGCDRHPKHCDAHHIKHWADGGATSAENGVLLCRHHHTLIHHSGWTVKMANGIPVFSPPKWLDPDRRPRRNLINAF
ncbi:HNH endonuclease [Lentzea alba]|uniref:HNH endonuclease signature motif containing protein n=1 Tax=Lentzea alba TaxID=2714351 RepID=UPI0039BF7846